MLGCKAVWARVQAAVSGASGIVPVSAGACLDVSDPNPDPGLTCTRNLP